VANNYGALSELVSVATSLMAAAGAIGLAWRGRAIAAWSPDDEDVPDGAQKVAGLLAAAAIAYEWAALRKPGHTGTLNILLIIFAGITVVGLLAYGFMRLTQTVIAIRVQPDGTTGEVKVISGFWLTPPAREKLKCHTIQDVFAGALYKPDLVWSRASRAFAKTVMLLSYMGLTACGTLLLATAALRIIAAIG
jgi:hypothetical protein